jgi:hypothetical protein
MEETDMAFDVIGVGMIMRQLSLARLMRGWLVRMKQKKKKKKKQIRVNHTREGIGRGCQPAGQVEGGQKERRGRRKGKKHRGAGEEPQHHHTTKPEQYGVRNAEWEVHHRCRQAREQQHRQKAEGGAVACRRGM